MTLGQTSWLRPLPFLRTAGSFTCWLLLAVPLASAQPSNPEPSPDYTPQPSNPEPSPDYTPQPGNPGPSPDYTPQPGNPEPSPDYTPQPSNPGPSPDYTPPSEEPMNSFATPQALPPPPPPPTNPPPTTAPSNPPLSPGSDFAPHPADSSGDRHLSDTELSTYASAWISGEHSQTDLLTLAAQIWLNGGGYSYDKNGTGAQRWKPAST